MKFRPPIFLKNQANLLSPKKSLLNYHAQTGPINQENNSWTSNITMVLKMILAPTPSIENHLSISKIAMVSVQHQRNNVVCGCSSRFAPSTAFFNFLQYTFLWVFNYFIFFFLLSLLRLVSGPTS
jgi:hypothetical protein